MQADFFTRKAIVFSSEAFFTKNSGGVEEKWREGGEWRRGGGRWLGDTSPTRAQPPSLHTKTRRRSHKVLGWWSSAGAALLWDITAVLLYCYTALLYCCTVAGHIKYLFKMCLIRSNVRSSVYRGWRCGGSEGNLHYTSLHYNTTPQYIRVN